MKDMTIQEKLQLQLELEGWHEIPSRTRKAVTMSHPGKDKNALVFLGKAGSLRIGRNYSKSIPAVYFKAKLLAPYQDDDDFE